MSLSSSASHPLARIRVDGPHFRDAAGRQVILRGVNLGGDCKLPWPDGATHHPTDFSDHRTVSFVGRPFPLSEADEHLARLAHWGFNCVRLLTTWEAIEHAGPGAYDTDYLDYFAEICRRAGQHGLYVFIDIHQDVWSRMTGGDGAPGWTFEAAGLDFTRFARAGVSHVMQDLYDPANPVKRQPQYPQMSWGSNYRLPANTIMWTLFWAGNLFVPEHRVGSETVQDYLQRHFLGAVDQVAARIAGMSHVMGFDSLNEPGTGWLGERLTYRHAAPSTENPAPPRVGLALSPLDGLAIASGLSVEAPVLVRNRATGRAEQAGTRVVNPDGISIWRDGLTCPFAAAGAWQIEAGRAVPGDDNFFRLRAGRSISVAQDGLRPLFHAVAATVRRHDSEWLLFAELDAYGAAMGQPFPPGMPANSVNASHWYDASTLYLKTFDPDNFVDFFSGRRADGEAAISRLYREDLAEKVALAQSFGPRGAPTLIGEFGIPYDLDDGASFAMWADGHRDPAIWRKQATLLALMYDALDDLQASSAQWNYTATNRNDLAIGDGWNQEDLSIYSPDQHEDGAGLDSGGRAINGFCRPYPRHVQGTIAGYRFDRSTRSFELLFEADPAVPAPTVVYVPRLVYPEGFAVAVAGADDCDVITDGQLVQLTAPAARRLTLIISGM